MIYTEINPNEIEKNTAGLVESIKRDGIKYPLVVQCNNKKINRGCFDVGNQRLLIALSLDLDKIPIILYSIQHKTGFKGTPITGINDIVKICGESIKDEPVYQIVVGVIKNIKRQNNYPPDPLKIQVQWDN